MGEKLRLGRVIAVWELSVHADKTAGAMHLTASIPGREGTLTRTWPVTKRGIDDLQVADMMTVLCSMVLDAVTTVGVQMVIDQLDSR